MTAGWAAGWLLLACGAPPAASPSTDPPAREPAPPIGAPLRPDASAGYVGVVTPREEVVLSAEIDGILISADRPVGSRVRPGELLGVIGSAVLAPERDAGRASVDAAEAAHAEARLGVANARRELADAEYLSAIGASASAERDQARFALDGALAAERRTAATLTERRAGLRGLDTRRDGGRLLAPFEGTVARWWVAPGERVASGEEVVRIAAVDTLGVRFAVPVGETVSVGQRVAVFTGVGRPPVEGTVRRVSPELELSSQTTFAEADLDATAGLSAGEECRVRVEADCGPEIEGAAALLAPGAMILLGEIHGTREIPAFVGALACRAAKSGIPVRLGLELPSADTDALSAWLDGDRAALLQREHWLRPQQDGRSSEAMLGLLDQIRVWRGSGLPIEPFGYDPGGETGEWNVRDGGMAVAILDVARAHPEALVLALSGNLHNRTTPGLPWDPDAVPMGAHVRAARPDTTSLDVRYSEGSAWVCLSPTACGPSPMTGTAGATARRIERWRAPDEHGYDGFFAVGPVSASPPAVPAGSLPSR